MHLHDSHRVSLSFLIYFSPLPNIPTLAILTSPRKSPPNHQNGVPKPNFPEFPGLGFSVELLQNFYRNAEFPGISRPTPVSAVWGPHFQRLGGNEVDMLGSADLFSLQIQTSGLFGYNSIARLDV